MKKIILILKLVVSGILMTNAQVPPYQEVQFLNFTPEWIFSPIDSSLVGFGSYDGRNHFVNFHTRPLPYLIHEGYLYCAHHTFYSLTMVEGALLQKIDLNDGKVMWQNHWDLRNNDRQEWIEAIYIEDDGRLNVLTARRIVEPKNDFGYVNRGDSSLISIRKYDIENGALVDHIVNEAHDLDSQRVRNSRSQGSILYPLPDRSFRYFELNENMGIISRYVLDQNGHRLEDPISDTIKLADGSDITDPDIRFTRRMYKASPDTLVAFDAISIETNDLIEKQTLVTIYDKDLNIINKYQIDTKLEYEWKRLWFFDADNDHIIISGEKVSGGFFDTLIFIIMTYDGNILHQFTGVYDDRNHSFSAYKYLEKENTILFSGLSSKYYGFNIAFINETNKIDLHRQFYFTDINYGFSSRIFYMLENMDVIAFGYTIYLREGIYFSNWPTWMRIKAGDLGLQGTSIQQVSEIPNIPIHPNPATHSITISHGHEGEARIEVLDVMGGVLIGKTVMSAGEDELDVSVLNAGLYVVRVLDGREVGVGRGKFLKR